MFSEVRIRRINKNTLLRLYLSYSDTDNNFGSAIGKHTCMSSKNEKVIKLSEKLE